MICFKYVTRMDYRKRDGRRSSRGWWVRVPNTPTKLFSDSVFGGRLRARDAALDYRDAMCRARGILVTKRVFVRRGPQSNTGILGVHVTRLGTQPRAVASWSPSPYVRRRAHFGFKKWGGRRAAVAAAKWFRLARQAEIRQAAEGEG